MTHYNIQIHIQRVDEPEAGRGALGNQVRSERRITEVLKLAITADSEQEAFIKAHRMLTAGEPTGLPYFVTNDGEMRPVNE